MKHALFASSLAAALALGGCRAYVPAPVDWDAECASGATGTVRLASPDDAARLALVGNREINARRLAAAGAGRVARASGWWEDPALDVDVMRILRAVEHPFLGGASLAFAVPLSGALARDAKAAEAYAEAEAAGIRAAERDLAVDARKAALRLQAALRRERLLDAYVRDERVRRARAAVERLHDAGEIPPAARAAVHRAEHARRHAQLDARRESVEADAALRRLLGLRPGVAVTLADETDGALPRPPRPPDVRALVRHPAVAAARARLDESEARLEAEIRRQYPDLRFGPAFADEEGLARLGFVAGVTLPLWNRNRKGVAEAEAARDGARREAIDVWRALVGDAAAARRAFDVLLAHPPPPPDAREDADRLADAGELAPTDYLAAREEILDARLAEADWRRDVALAAAELERFTEGD